MKRKKNQIIAFASTFMLAFTSFGMLPQIVTADDSIDSIDREIVFTEEADSIDTGGIAVNEPLFGYSIDTSSLSYYSIPDTTESVSDGISYEETVEEDNTGDDAAEDGNADQEIEEESIAGESILEDESIIEDEGVLEDESIIEDEGVLEDESIIEDEGVLEDESIIEDNTEAAVLMDSELASGNCGESLLWSLSDEGTLTVSGSGDMEQYSTSSPAPWSGNMAQISSVVIEEGVTSIGTLAFYGCSNLTSLQLPSTLTIIEEAAFYECYSLPEVNIPGGVTELGTAAFGSCDSLSTLTGGEGLKKINAYAFQFDPLSEFTIPATMEELNGLAFYGCTCIKRFLGGNSVYQVSDEVIFTDNGTTLFKYPAGKTGTYVIPEGVVVIADQAFISCSGLSEVTIPSTTTTLGSSAFQECTSLATITIPDSVSSVDNFTFYQCSSLESVKIGSGLKATSYEMFMYCTSLNSIDFGGLEELYNRSFYCCTGLQKVTIPVTVKKVGSGAFYGCSGLEEVEYYADCDYIPSSCFSYCSRLKTVILREGIKYIYAYAFYGDENIEKVTLPSTITHCVDLAFSASTVIQFTGAELSAYGTSGYVRTDLLSINGTEDYEEAYQVLEIVNSERAAEGLEPLYMDEELLAAAVQRSAEMAILFSHTRPNSTICFTASSKMTAENIAAGQRDASSAMNSWMNSPGHRANILEPASTSIGIGCFKHNGMTYWVQCFGQNELSSNCIQPQNVTKDFSLELYCEDFDEYVAPGSFVFNELEHYVFSFAVEMEKTEVLIGEKTTAHLTAANGNLSYAEATFNNFGFEWRTENEAVAAVSDDGEVTGMSAGSTNVFVLLPNRGKSQDKTVSVKAPHIHSPAEPVKENEKPATCTTKGSYDEVIYCSDCGEVISRETKTTEKTAHKPVVMPAKDPTCTETGLTEGSKCSVCGEILKSQTEIEKLGHKIVKVNAKAATLKAAGNTAHYKCSRCKKLFKDKDGKTATTAKAVTIAKLINISKAEITGITSKTYTGKALTQNPKVVYNGKTLTKGTDYTLSYKNCKNAGKATASVTITGKGKYGGSVTKKYTINKAANPLKIATTSIQFKRSELTGKKTFSIGASKNQGTVTYTRDSKATNAKITVTKKGVVTVPKNCKAGTYMISVKAAGNDNYKPVTKKVTIKVINK